MLGIKEFFLEVFWDTRDRKQVCCAQSKCLNQCIFLAPLPFFGRVLESHPAMLQGYSLTYTLYLSLYFLLPLLLATIQLSESESKLFVKQIV